MQVVAYTLCLFTLRKNCQERRKTLQVKLLQISALFGLFYLAYYQTTFNLVDIWLKFDESLSHGLLVVAMAIYLLAKNLRQDAEKKISIAAISCLLCLSLTWLIFATLNIDILEQLILLPILAAGLWCVIGTQPIYKLLPCVSLLIFAIPIWDYLAKPLVYLSTQAVTLAIELTNLTAFIEGNQISLPFGVLVIADGCSGVRYLTVALAIAYYLCLDSVCSFRKKLILILTSLALGVFSNWLRIFLITVIAYHSDMQSSVVDDHELFGWIVFAVMFAPILYFGGRLKAKSPCLDIVKLYRHPTALILMLGAAFAGPILYSVHTPTYSAPDLDIVDYTELKNSKTFDGFIFPKSKAIFGYSKRSQVKVISIVNWRASRAEDLVPYWPQKFSTRWVVGSSLDWPNNKQLNDVNASLIMLSNSHSSLKRCVALSYNTAGFKTNNYSSAKLAQIPALLVNENYFIANIVYLDTTLGTCENEAVKLLTVIKNLRITQSD
jgi:exosortase